MRKPIKLKPNDRVAIVAPSQAARADTVNRAVKTVRSLGLNPVVCASCFLVDDTSDVPDEARAADINNAFADKTISGLVALRAGSGTLSLLEHLDYELIGANPKAFVGFSDITGLHLALETFCEMVTFYGPLATSNVVIKGPSGRAVDGYTHRSFQASLFTSDPIGAFSNPEGEALECLLPGVAKGQLVGGNLTLLVKTLGTRYEVNTCGRVLLMEDFGESLVSLSGMLHQLADANKFAECIGVVLGPWIKCGEEIACEQERKAGLERILREILVPFGKPVLSNVRSGHCVPMATLPLGIDVEMDAGKGELRFTEAATE